MDIEDPEFQGGELSMDNDSGSLYAENGESSRGEDEIRVSRRSSVQAGSHRSISKARKVRGEDGISISSSQSPEPSDRASPSHGQIVEDAQKWATSFKPPESVEDIKSPWRNKRRKRQAKPPHEAKRLRLKSYHNIEYRELLNVDILQAATRSYQEDLPPLQPSQIGSSIWTASEKNLFFTAVAILGKDNVRGIADRIGSKSELEVQEYIRILNTALAKKQTHDPHDTLIAPTEIPAALEVSPECCDLLERAGDAIAARQECAEAQIEAEKWGDIWLITSSVAQQLDRRRREENGEEELNEVLPAANLFILKNWIELSEDVFMNPGGHRLEDNWEEITEVGEYPAIRATAFEDFHSLAVSFTKRLISTTFYCTMSRLKARGSNKIKHAEVNPNDVEAAVNILGMAGDSRLFWKECARRCNLQVVNDDQEPEREMAVKKGAESTPSEMTYAQVEDALTFLPNRRSRSRSISRPSTPRPLSSQESTSPEANKSPINELDAESEFSDNNLSSMSETEFATRSRDASRAIAHQKAKLAAIQAYEAYLDSFDCQASKIEETRLWSMLKQTPPFELEIKDEQDEKALPPKYVRDSTEGENWREWTEYWSPWETMESPVPRITFDRNRGRRTKIGRRREELARNGDLRGPDSIVDGEEGSEAQDGGGAVYEEISSHEEDDEDLQEDRMHEDSSARSPSPSQSGSELERLAFEEGSPSRYRSTDDED